MNLEHLALAKTDNFPIKHQGNVHNGKVRSVYWLSDQDSARIVAARSFEVDPNAQLGIMIISDRISAFDCNWKGEEGLQGVPGKGAALNAISQYWFKLFDQAGFAGNHILETPHPLVWLVEKAEPVMVEAVGRQYITGSMLRDYKLGVREFCGIQLPDGLRDNQRLPDLLITPTTKGTLVGIPGVQEKEDVNITRKQIIDNYAAFGFKSPDDVERYEELLRKGFAAISYVLTGRNQIFVDTKFEFGYVRRNGNPEMIFIDEAGTPDSSRIWDETEYQRGNIIERSKEGFRQHILKISPDVRDMMLKKDRMPERMEFASKHRVPVAEMLNVSKVYEDIAIRITGEPVPDITDARSEILDSLSPYGILT